MTGTASPSVRPGFRSFLTQPFRDVLDGLETSLTQGPRAGYGAMAILFLGLAVGWWVYVPVHELLHAFGCWVTGGSVGTLEISRLYGGDLFAAIFPFVQAGSEYAGRLSGFDTHGSDLVYLATDFAPFLLTIFPGIWLLRRTGRRAQPFLFGFVLPLALSPFMSLIGDAYEIGSILVTNLPPWSDMLGLRGDDLAIEFKEAAGQGAVYATGLTLATLLGALWAWTTYGLGTWVAKKIEGDASATEPRSLD